MIGAFFDYLSKFFASLGGKLTAASPQIDFGNFTVGLATMIIAVVSLYVAVKSNRSGYRQRIAEFRQQWIESVRESAARHSKLSIVLLDAALRTKDKNEWSVEQSELLAEIMEIETLLRLKLNPEEGKHRDFIRELVKMRTALSKIRKSDNKRKDASRFVGARNKATNLAKDIFKEEWERLKDELHGRSWPNRRVRNFFRQRRKSTSEWFVIPTQLTDEAKEPT